MLVQRPEAAADAEEDLFAGMSFPDAPTDSIVISANVAPEDTRTVAVPAAEPKVLETVCVAVAEASSSADGGVSIEAAPAVAPAASAVETPRSSWSSLYSSSPLAEAEEAAAAQSRYPVLPPASLVPRFTASPPSQLEEVSSSRLPVAVVGQGQGQGNAASSSPQQPVHAWSALVAEVHHDQAYEQVSAGGEQMPLLHELPSAPPDTYMYHSHPSVMTGALHHPQQQNGTATASGPATDKYVCCGQCRQWLKVPREVQMVHCPQCNVVNNCALVQPQSSSALVRSDPNRTGGGISAWLSFCFENIATDFHDLSNSFMGTRAELNRQPPPQYRPQHAHRPPRGPPGALVSGRGRGPPGARPGFHGGGLLGGRGRPPPPPPGHGMDIAGQLGPGAPQQQCRPQGHRV